MTEPHVISGHEVKRSAVAGQIIDVRQQMDRLRADLFHIYAVLKLYGLEADELPTKGRMPKRSAYFSQGEISRRCYDLLRERGTISADDVSVQAMLEQADRKHRADFTRRILVSLHDLRKSGAVEKIGDKRGVRWKLITVETDYYGRLCGKLISWYVVSPKRPLGPLANGWFASGPKGLLGDTRSSCQDKY